MPYDTILYPWWSWLQYNISKELDDPTHLSCPIAIVTGQECLQEFVSAIFCVMLLTNAAPSVAAQPVPSPAAACVRPNCVGTGVLTTMGTSRTLVDIWKQRSEIVTLEHLSH